LMRRETALPHQARAHSLSCELFKKQSLS
jgi:hypothetical protein